MPGMRRSFPMQVSMMMRRSPTVTPKAWIDSTRSPSSSTKWGRSHDECDATTSGVASGSSPAGGMCATLSTTRVTVRSPTFHCRLSLTLVPCRRPSIAE